MYKTRKQKILFTSGFALPTVLVASVVLLMVLVTAVSTTVAVRNGLREQNYLRQAGLAAEAGNALATACLGLSNGAVTWSDANPLRPNTDCNGVVNSAQSAYVLDSTEDGFRTYFVVDSSREAKGYVEALRASSGLAWRVWTSTVSAAQGPGGDANPVGTYIDGAWTTAPAGYLLTDGSCVSRDTYANLFAVIGTTYGTCPVQPDAPLNFRLPDTRGRVAVTQSTDTEFDTMGEKYGAKTHTLMIAEMPAHNHVEQFYSPSNGGLRPIGGSAAEAGGSGKIFDTPAGGSTSVYATTQATGGGAAHNNIQPSIVVKTAIKY